MNKIYQQLLKVLSSFDYMTNYFNVANNPVKNLQYKLLDALKGEIRSMAWEAEHRLSKSCNDSADIFGSNDQAQVVIELDTTRADQVAKKMVSRFYYCCGKPTIYIALLYPGTDNMSVNECKKYFKYGKKLLMEINEESMFIGVILGQDGTVQKIV